MQLPLAVKPAPTLPPLEPNRQQPFGLYIHVPFCASRCGYCDFNTYTPGELGSSASPQSYLAALEQELEHAAGLIGRPAQTVFIGGGTPSLLGAAGLGRILDAVRATVGLAPGAEVTTESNPESTSEEFFAGLLEGGFTRVSLGMQSVSERVLAVLDRRHTPGRALAAAREALAAGFEHVNLDVIYGTPGEKVDDVRATVEAALATGVDHISAYSLIVEPGTAMFRKVSRGQLPAPDEDVMAERYELIDAALVAAGMHWYEVSNWARPGGQCQHNMLYWRAADWWGAGPGAHSHINGVRFFNVKHPARYAALLGAGDKSVVPVQDFEVLGKSDRHTEEVMLGLRLREGLSRQALSAAGNKEVNRYIAAGLMEATGPGGGDRVAVTGRGRLLADGIIADILVAEEREG